MTVTAQKFATTMPIASRRSLQKIAASLTCALSGTVKTTNAKPERNAIRGRFVMLELPRGKERM
jgi:hypothetical protein